MPMNCIRMPLGHAASHSPWFVQVPKPSASILATILSARSGRSGWPCGRQRELRDLGGGEEHRRSVRAGGHARAAADAGGRVHREVGVLLADRDGVAVGGAADRSGDETAGGDDPVERSAVDDEVLDDGERRGPPGLERQDVAVGEAAHVELADGRLRAWTVRPPVDDEAAGPADALAAVVVEGDRVFALEGEGLVEDVEHLEKGHLGIDVGRLVGDEAAFRLRVLLPPDLERDLHL